MPDVLDALSQRELMALVAEATDRGDAAHALAYLKAAVARDDRTPEALFLLGSEYAQIKLFGDAIDCMTHAVAAAPQFSIARFQLGMLHLTGGDAAQAKSVWAPLAELDDTDPRVYLKRFHRGLLHLIADEFEQSVRFLESGISVNSENEPLNADMRRIIDAVAHLPGAQVATPVDTPPEAVEAGAGSSTDEVEPSHLFVSAYATRGKPH